VTGSDWRCLKPLATCRRLRADCLTRHCGSSSRRPFVPISSCCSRPSSNRSSCQRFRRDRRWGRSLSQLTQSHLREPGIPTPSPRLGRDGANLPAVLGWLKEHDLRAFHTVLNTVSTVMPSLEDIDVVPTARRELGLAFQEMGFSSPWSAKDVSDGTIRALGLVTALFDPSVRVVLIEEPENYLHSWAIGQFVDALREVAETKQIILTTHSPVLIDQVRPEDIWVVSKQDAETRIDRLDDLDPDARIGWEEGKFTLSKYLNSGIVPQAVPVL